MGFVSVIDAVTLIDVVYGDVTIVKSLPV